MKEKLSRRSAVRNVLLAGTAGLTVAQSGFAKQSPTPPDIEGPFHPVQAQKDKDFDLTQVEGREGKAKGEVLEIRGKVLDTDGKAITDATVELWQANAAGKYDHPRDPNKAPIDPNFQGWAIVPSGKDGEFKFKTIKPGAYPAAKDWVRPPHIHFKISKFGFQPLTTQMYFPDETALNEVDALLQRKDEDDQALMIAKPSEDKEGVLIYNIVLAKARDAVSKQAE